MVSSGATAQFLAQKIAGSGVTILNTVLTCPVWANGVFSVADGAIGLDSGVVLTTGRAATSGTFYGINGSETALASTDNYGPGDAQLEVLSGQKTGDACSLEFDVIPGGTTLGFNYVFSSEEYINAVCGPYNDAFAFFISGPGIVGYQNMALVPGTNIPVTINSINNGIPGPAGFIDNCTKMGAGSPFSGYYLDNTSGKVLTHKGRTSVLRAVHNVTPCSSYHLKIVVADAGNRQYDSGVFLEAGSLQTDNYSISSIASMPSLSKAFCVKGCLPGHFRVKRTMSTVLPQTIKFFTAGSALSGVDYKSIADSIVIPANATESDILIDGLPTPLSGPKSLTLYILSPYSCAGASQVLDSATLLIYDTMHVSLITPDMLVCGNDSTALQVHGDSIFNYVWSPAVGLSNPLVKEPVAFPFVNTTYKVVATLPGTPCTAKSDEVNFYIKLTPGIVAVSDTTVCYMANFPLKVSVAEDNLYYKYRWTGPNDFTSTLSSPIVENAGLKTEGNYNLTITNDTNGCKSFAALRVSVDIPSPPQVTSPVVVCLNSPPASLLAKGEHITWYNSAGVDSLADAPLPETNQLTAMTFYVSQTPAYCTSPKARVDVEVKQCCDGIINIPTAFTPNGDGRNDRFEPMANYGYSIKSVLIVNRWGQTVYSGQDASWDGSFGGVPAEMGAYFYLISYNCVLGGTVVLKGDITLIR